jgi:hypothetical protein
LFEWNRAPVNAERSHVPCTRHPTTNLKAATAPVTIIDVEARTMTMYGDESIGSNAHEVVTMKNQLDDAQHQTQLN